MMSRTSSGSCSIFCKNISFFRRKRKMHVFSDGRWVVEGKGKRDFIGKEDD